MEQLISLIRQQQERSLSGQQIGIVVDGLYRLDYFNDLAQSYGKSYLSFLIQHYFIDIYNLRKKRPLIDVNSLYILLMGQVNKNGFSSGTEIMVERDGQIWTTKDSSFLKISIKKIKTCPKLKQLQKSINENRFMIDHVINESKQKYELSQRLAKIQTFGQLSRYDFNELIARSDLRTLGKGKSSHEVGSQVQSLIFILEGQLRLSFPYQLQNKSKRIDQFLQRYLVKKSPKNKEQIVANYCQRQWIGLNEHNQQTNYKSYGVVMSVVAQLLFIPVQVFDKIFNEKTNYALFKKIYTVDEIKLQSIEKKSYAQRKKQSQILRWSQQNLQLLPELKRKISNYKLQDKMDSPNLNPQFKKEIGFGDNSQNIQLKFGAYLSVSASQQKKRIKKSLPNSLNKFKKKQFPRINLFSQEYEKQFVYPSQKREIEEAQMKKKINLMMYLQPKNHRKACERHCSDSNQGSEGKYFQNKLFQMAKNVTHNYALGSSFYRSNYNKGDEFSNLNFKTIISIQPSKKELLLSRKSQNYQQNLQRQHSLSNTSFLPGLRTKSTVKNFNPMSSRDEIIMDLSQQTIDQMYNIESKNTSISRRKSSYQTISSKDSKGQINDFREHSRTLFVKVQREEKRRVSKTIDLSMMNKRQLKKESSRLQIH